MRRLLLCSMALLLLTVPAFARRRAITPGSPTHCVLGTVLPATYAQSLALDNQFVYFVDEAAALGRVPKLGGMREDLAELEDWLPLAMAVDDTTVYVAAIPFDALFIPLPGSILAVPKSGGVVRVLASGVMTPFDLTVDATHVYWVASGTIDFQRGTALPDGKIERARKDGAERQVLAADLSVPTSLAIDDSSVYFGESGAAEGDSSLGLYRVAKSGGARTTIDPTLGVLSLAVDGNTILLFGGNETTGGLMAVEKTGESLRLLAEEDSVSFALRITDRRVYYIRDNEVSGELVWVNIDTRENRTVRNDLDTGDFLLDGCAAIVGTTEGDLIRTAR